MGRKRFLHGGLVLVTSAAFMMSSCALPSRPNIEQMHEDDTRSLPLLTDKLTRESEKMSVNQQLLLDSLQKVTPQSETIEPVEPYLDPLESVSVTIDVSNGDAQFILRAIADQAGMNLLLAPDLSLNRRHLTLHLQDVPARLVFDHVMELLDLYGEVDGNVMKVQPFQSKTYSLDFLQTSLDVDFSSGGDVFGANSIEGGGDSGGSSLQGNFSLNGKSPANTDPYEQLENMLDSLIGKKQVNDSDNNNKNNNPVYPQMGFNAQQSRTQMVEQQDLSQGWRFSPVYSLNRLTGTLFVNASPSQIKTVTNLIERYKEVLQRQILIEAQILDVSLNDGHQYGVDWSVLRGEVASAFGAGGVQLGSISTTMGSSGERSVVLPSISLGSTASSLGAAYVSDTFTAAINLLKQFGVVRVLSNPTLRAKNARPSLISVGTSSRYVSETTSVVNNLGTGSTTSSSVVTDSVFDGIVVGVIPFVDDDENVNLTFHPIQTEVDPTSLVLQNVGDDTMITLPVVDFKGLTTSLTLRDGDTVILGGLIDEKGSSSGDGMPLVSDIPGIGYLFGSSEGTSSARELVIVLKVHVL